ncbi:MAG TPA: phage holin family protein [Candidatus Saccharimonadales bacterium]|nr:phage holin family protein [Candidatus Saccharimonadales bacterium]
MKKPPLYRFLIRWLVSTLGLWIAAAILSNSITYGNSAGVIIIAGLILAIVNTILKPLIVILSLPAIVLTVGLFMVVVNGFMVYLVSKLYGSLHITNFWAAIVAGMVIGLVNYLVGAILEKR